MAIPAGLGSQRHAALDLLRAADGYEAGIVRGLAELNGRGSHAAGPGVDEHPLTTLQTCFHVKVEISGGKDLGQRRRLQHVQPRRHRQDLPRGDRDALRVAASGQERADPIAGLYPGHAFPRGQNLSRAFQAQDLARSGRRRISSRALHQVRTVDGGRVHGDQHLANASLRLVDFLPAQTLSLDGNGLHRSP